MPLHQDLLKKLLDFLKTSSLFKSVPLSLLLIGLEALIDQHFSCPCKVLQNRLLTVAIFIGPALFTFCLMFLFVRPFRHEWFHCPDGVNDDTQKNWPKFLISCLIPPVMWIFILFLDGDYFTCGMTDWDGCYIFNKKMNMSWCHPYPEGNNTWCDTSSEDHGKMHRTLEYFHNSEFIGYCVISVFSVLAVVFVGIYDCFVTGKCDCLPNRLLCCCGRRLPYSGENQNTAGTQNAAASDETPAAGSNQNQNTAGTQNAAASDETPAAGSNQNQNTAGTQNAAASDETPAAGSNQNQNTAGTQNAAASDETPAAGSNQNQTTAESIQMRILRNQENQET